MYERHKEAVRLSFAPTANLMAMYASAHGHNAKPEDFMPTPVKRDADGPGIEAYNSFMRAAIASQAAPSTPPHSPTP